MTNQDMLRRISVYLAIAGLIDSIYLTIIKLSNQKALCIQGMGDCWTVNTSKYSEFMGIPVSIFGAGAYILILILLLLEANGTFWRENSVIFVLGLTLAGVLYSAYLTYLEIAIIRAVCPFCVISAIVMVILFGLTVTRLIHNQQNLILD